MKKLVLFLMLAAAILTTPVFADENLYQDWVWMGSYWLYVGGGDPPPPPPPPLPPTKD